MSNNISSIVKLQIPEALSLDARNLQLFLEAYYEYLSSTKNASWLINKNHLVKDIDNTLQEFVDHFYNTYAEFIPRDSAYNSRDLLKKIVQLYKLKGTTAGLKLFFRLVFNQEIDISYPQEQMLRASDSKWVQESSFRLRLDTLNEDSLNSIFSLEWSNSAGDYSVQVSRVERLEDNVYEFFFNISRAINLFAGDIVSYKDAVTGEVLIRGQAITTTNKIEILKPGKNFRVGQLFSSPGTVKPLLFRIVDVGAQGQIARVQIIDYGYETSQSDTIDISPFSNVPIKETVNVESVLNPDNLTFTHSIAIEDIVSPLSDRGLISKEQSFGTLDSYFSNDYLLGGTIDPTDGSVFPSYFGAAAGSFSSAPPAFVGNATTSNVSIELENESKATVRTSSGTINKYVGRYETVGGHISDSNIKIQDSYFYQIYSYVINSRIQVGQYSDTLYKIFHPAGKIFFSNLEVDSTLEIRDNIGVFINKIFRLELEDNIAALDNIFKTTTKETFEDLVEVPDETTKTSTKATFEESVTPLDESKKTFTKAEFDTLEVTDSETVRSIIKDLEETVIAEDALESQNTYSQEMPSYFAGEYVGTQTRDDFAKTITPELKVDTVNLTDIDDEATIEDGNGNIVTDGMGNELITAGGEFSAIIVP